MGLFDVFKKNDKEEGNEGFQSMERSADAPTAEEVKQAVAAPAEEIKQAADTSSPVPPVQQAAGKAQGAARPLPKNMVLPAITPNKLMSVSNPDILKREDKARVLAYFIERYESEKTVANLESCLKNFVDVWLWVPMRMQFSASDAAGLKAQTADKKYVPKDPVRLVPELLKLQNGDVLYFSFTSRDEISDEFLQKYVWMQMPSIQCATFIAKHSVVTAIVVNPFSKNIALKRDFMMKYMKSNNPDGKKE